MADMLVHDEGKRWIVVGIALNKVAAPVLRTFAKQEITKLYAHYDSACNLKTLTQAQASAHPELKLLKFKNINNNHLQGSKSSYNYNIDNEVDLAKLYLPVYFAKHFSAFDESLEMSAILGLLVGNTPPSIFVSPCPLIQAAAEDVRDNVRNKWGHFNNTEWTDSFFNDCFDKIEVLIKCLGLKDGGKTSLDQLADWRTKGPQLCMGHPIDQDLFQFVQQDLNALVEDFKKIEKQQLATQDSLVEIQDQQSSKRARLDVQEERLKGIEENHRILRNLISFQKSPTDELSTRLKQVKQKLSSEEISVAGKSRSSSGGKECDTCSASSCQDDNESDDWVSESTSGVCGTESLDTSIPQMYKDLNFELYINPSTSELEGGNPFSLVYDEKLPEEVHEAWVLFDKTTYVKIIKWDDENCFSGLKIPPGQKPGFATVEVFTQDKVYSLGTTRIFYLDKNKRKKMYQQLVHNPDRRCEFFEELAASLRARGVGGSTSGSTSSSSHGVCNQEGSLQPADVHLLQTLVDTAAETDAYEFLHMVFNTSAGRVAFDAYKNILLLPEDTARLNGHEKTAQYLKEVFQRFSMEERSGEEQMNEVDWAELERAAKVSQQGLTHPSNEEELKLHRNVLIDKFGCLETPSAELTVKNWLENQNTEHAANSCQLPADGLIQKQHICFSGSDAKEQGELDGKKLYLGSSTMEYSLEELNYFRICQIAIKLVPAGLRQIFKQEWDYLYGTTLCGMWQDTPQNGSDFYHKETERRKATMNARYLNIIRNGNTAEWDCSCLFSAILYSSSIGTTLSPTVQSNVDDLRKVRNDIAHITEDTLTDAQFLSYAGRVLNAFTTLGLSIKEIDDVKNQTGFPTAEVETLKKEIYDLKLDQTKFKLQITKNELQSAQDDLTAAKEQNEVLTQEINSKLQPFCSLPFTPPNEIIRRGSDLPRITKRMQELYDNSNGAVSAVYLSGNPGCGKTQIARQIGEEFYSVTSRDTKNELQSAQDDLTAAKEQNEVLTQEINSKLQPFCSLPFTPPHEIIRRGSDLARITKRMQELYDNSNGAVSTVYLSGNPGCGKTQIARQIGEEFYSVTSRDTEGLVFVATLNAETLESLTDSYITLARKLSIPLYVIKELEKSKTNEPKETLNQAMRMARTKISTFSNWLIIADNVVDLKSVRSYLPQTASKEWGHGQVLITTQDSIAIPSNAPHTYHDSLKEGMQREDAVQLLTKVSQFSNQEQVEQVAEDLDYQPLPLAAAAFYVQTVVSGGSPDYSWTEYLDALRKGQREATEEVLAEHSVAYIKPMTKAVKMAIERAVEISDVMSQTFAFFSLCASEPVTVGVVVSFAKARLESHMTEELIRATILKSSLIVSEEVEDGAPKYLRLHGIVHDVLKTLPLFHSDYTKKPRCIAASINIFESQLQEHLSRAEYGHRELRRFTSHSKVLCRIAFSNSDTTASLPKILSPFVIPEKVVSWLRFTAAACLELSDLSHAERLSQLACDLLHYVSMETQRSLLRSQVFETRGSVLNRLCDFNSALSCHQEALDIRIKLYGEEHGDVARSYNNLGVVCRNIGQHDQAKEFYEKALNIRIKLYGEEHGAVAASYNNLGVVCSNIGQHDQAKEFHEKALNIQIKLYGEEHGAVAASYNNLGVACSNIGQHNQAKEFYEKALNIQIKLYGEEPGDVAASYNNLGVVCRNIGQHEKAKEFHEKALNIQIKLYGEEHGDVAASYNNLGVVCRNIGQHDQAKEFYEKALNIQIKLYGEENGAVAASYNNLGVVCSNIGQHEKAKEFHEKALTIQIKLYGEEHGAVAASYNNLGVVCRNIGQHDKAKEFHEKALNIQIKLYGEEHGAVAASYNNLGVVCRNIGQHDQAKEFYEKALNIKIKLYGEENGDVARSYNNLGVVCRSIGQHDQAKKFHEKALNIQRRLLNPDHMGKAVNPEQFPLLTSISFL